MRTICLEVRDSMTFIPVMATSSVALPYLYDNGVGEGDGAYKTEQEQEEFLSRLYLLSRSGYPIDGSVIIVVNLNDCRASNDPYGWGNSRTMQVAHEYIEQNWSTLKDGDVIDVEFILGETTEKKVSERFER